MERATVAYLLLIGMALAAILGLLYRRHHSHVRTYARQRQREEAAHQKQMTEKD